ncbi:glutaredoxin 3 [Neoehrlichia mikurensis]|uniref:Glutaredoxin n=1 Tax=Neoehrlichia mikurensis TaxID=89586 RepID=A0A9Q9F5J4_9RICK|nr:glutaredoxin 3 [Neoehrlichia mikurensis]QXK91636.1 glutaredoxin 3 [Neoehrlichia mikurensis]QXK92847.1 glutaredoxin 3 [Neoehrlichia mikurensis]QXK93327.1 glutaredoxin 3 [Neoehrlichia mikurensis]UTO55731.1 glutaredoxin 3 [Neoehrlichia mikurensis]UTO56648.1 glutaredoxin 3 [Neoehrlichia mikurensis]
MLKIVIYTKSFCPYCTKAKILFNKKNVPFKEIDITNDEQARNEMIKNSGGNMTVPQIFIDGKHIGGCDDLYAAYESGIIKL